MSRPLSLFLGAAVAAAMSAVPAAAISPAPAADQQNGIVLVERDWSGSHWNDWDGDRHWRHRHRHRDRDYYGPGFSFNFGVPGAGVYFGVAPRRECYTTWDGRRFCRSYY